MSKKDKALKLALAVLKEWRKGFPDDWTDFDTLAVNTIEEILAQPEPTAIGKSVADEEAHWRNEMLSGD